MNRLPFAYSLKQQNERLYYLDNIRTAVIILVVLHHIAMVYGAFAPFYYTEQPFNKKMLIFCIVNQSWFMGIMFLLAGYFTPGSFERKGPVRFLKDKLLRLGIPALFFYFILNPLSSLGVYFMPSHITGIESGPQWKDYFQLTGLGPSWFVVMLLILSLGYLVIRIIISKGKKSVKSGLNKSVMILIAVLFPFALAGIAYTWRIFVPIGVSFWDFPTPGYFPQYIIFFITGIILQKYDLIKKLSNKIGIVGFIIAVISTVILFPLAFSGKMFSLALTPAFTNSMGRGHWQSVIYTLWDSFFAIGISLGLIVFFNHFMNKGKSFSTFLSRLSYTVYIIHIPIIVLIAVIGKNFNLNAYLKAGAASFVIVPLCFLFAGLILKIPGLKKIL